MPTRLERLLAPRTQRGGVAAFRTRKQPRARRPAATRKLIRVAPRPKKQGLQFHETGAPHQCQCDIACNRRAIAGQPFCSAHQYQCPSRSPLTGAEPDFEPAMWNGRDEFRLTHNCFSYAMNVIDPKQLKRCRETDNCNVPFHQPGSSSGHRGFDEKHPKTCPNMMARMFGDNPNVQFTDFGSKCAPNASKIALIIDESDDYHFLRQDSNGFWSHKPGAQQVTNVDAYGHRIWNPKLANYNYVKAADGKLNYDIFCSFMCVPRNQPLYLRVGGGGRLQPHRP